MILIFTYGIKKENIYLYFESLSIDYMVLFEHVYERLDGTNEMSRHYFFPMGVGVMITSPD
jgi:hypothetical protein